MAAKKQTGQAEPKGYAEAMSELDSLLRDLESSSIDVDALSSKVTRASYLIDWCNERITAVQMTIDELVAGFDDGDDDDEDDDE